MPTTTSNFQIKPDYYNSDEECNESLRNKHQTNLRYRNFTQTHFTAGDEEQFQYYRYEKNVDLSEKDISLDSNIFCINEMHSKDNKNDIYSNLNAVSVLETFRYLFYKFKKGIFIKILDNELKVFLPFSNVNFINEWSHNIKIDPIYGDLFGFIKYISNIEGYNVSKNNINEFINTWYGNNCLVRYEYPMKESDTNISNIKNMIEELCQNRQCPDIEFFINRRDFPLLTKNGTEPYYHLWNSMEHPLVSHNYSKYTPILSMSKTDHFADILMPSHEDWARVQAKESKFFCKTHVIFNDNFNDTWDIKIPTAIFRGSSTGYGVTIETNQRLKVSYISHIAELDKNGVPYIDAGITKWNVRPRKFMNSQYLETIEVDKLPFKLKDHLSPIEQSNYKYIIHIDGHVSAFRLSYELNMNSVILLVKNRWKMWYSDMLVEYIHYIPIKEDLSDILDQIKWCRDNDEKCKEIAKNAKKFYNTYLSKNAIFDYLQKTLVELKKTTGIYLYNVIKPLDFQIQNEYKKIKYLKTYPITDKLLNENSIIPKYDRSYGLLRGIHLIINMNKFKHNSTCIKQIFSNKLGVVNEYSFLDFSFAVKSTNDDNKIKEHIHETYISLTCINKLVKLTPNFVYNFGLYKTIKNDSKYYNVITEYIEGQTLKAYITDQEFSFQKYIFIILQICLALHVAQKEVSLVHNDLTPWNIIIRKLDKPINVDYVINHTKVIRIKTDIIPVIIDYGKAHVIYENMHYGFINMFSVSSITDILSLLITSIYQISTEKHLDKNDFNSLLKLANFMTNTKYCKKAFTSSKDLKLFLYNAKKYSNLISDNKYELESRTPFDLFMYIQRNIRYKFDITTTNEYTSLIDNIDPNQVFDYILSKNLDERLRSYIYSLETIKNEVISFNSDNLLITYYTAQNIENTIGGTLNNMHTLIGNARILNNKYINDINNIVGVIRSTYHNRINKENIYNGSSIINKNVELPHLRYTEDIFLLPGKIREYLLQYKKYHDYDSLSDYKNILEYALTTTGRYSMSELHRNYYIKYVERIFTYNNKASYLNNTNVNTLIRITSSLYHKDKKCLENTNTNNTEIINKINIYNDILELL